MDKIFAEDKRMDETDIEMRSGDNKPILPASYGDSEEWVQQYREQFGTEPSFF